MPSTRVRALIGWSKNDVISDFVVGLTVGVLSLRLDREGDDDLAVGHFDLRREDGAGDPAGAAESGHQRGERRGVGGRCVVGIVRQMAVRPESGLSEGSISVGAVTLAKQGPWIAIGTLRPVLTHQGMPAPSRRTWTPPGSKPASIADFAISSVVGKAHISTSLRTRFEHVVNGADYPRADRVGHAKRRRGAPPGTTAKGHRSPKPGQAAGPNRSRSGGGEHRLIQQSSIPFTSWKSPGPR